MEADSTRIDIQFDPTRQRMRGIAAHGNVPFDVPFVSPITDDLWQGGCQDGLILPAEVQHVVSLYPWESYQTNRMLRSKLEVKMYDSAEGVDGDQVASIADWVNERRGDGNGVVLVHCQAGLNRSALIVATALVLGDGMDPRQAVSLLRRRRSPAVLCNPTFERFVLGLRP